MRVLAAVAGSPQHEHSRKQEVEVVSLAGLGPGADAASLLPYSLGKSGSIEPAWIQGPETQTSELKEKSVKAFGGNLQSTTKPKAVQVDGTSILWILLF